MLIGLQAQITPLWLRHPAISPDGKSIVFQLSQTTREGPFQLYIMALDRPEKLDWILLTDYEMNGGSPVWQP